MRVVGIVAVVLAALLGLLSPAHGQPARLRVDAQAYTNAYITADLNAAWDLLSTRCQAFIGRHHFDSNSIDANYTYGQPHQITTFYAHVHGRRAELTYSFADAPGLDKTAQPWVRQRGAWRNDDC